MRVCNTCGEEKPLHEYYKNGKCKHSGAVAHRLDCKVCYNIGRKLDKKKHKKFANNTRHRVADMYEPVLSISEWRAVMVLFKGECAYCGHVPSKRGERLTKDHIVAVSKGGNSSRANIVPACEKCNCSKGNRDINDWYPRQPFYSAERLGKIRGVSCLI